MDRKWVIITDLEDCPLLVLEAESYLCHWYGERPILVTSPEVTLDAVIEQLEVQAEHRDDFVVDKDVILYWNDQDRRIITGADILGRLLKGIVQRKIA